MLSVVVPVYNEEENIIPLYNEIIHVMTTQTQYFEIIFVDDGSTDSTLSQLLSLLTGRDAHLKIIQLRKNFGQTAALVAGFHSAKGDIIISLDGDGQNDPNDIPKLLSALTDDLDVVCGWRQKRYDSFILKSIPSKISNFLNRRLNRLKIHDSGCTFRAYKRDSIDNITLVSGEHRYLPAILSHKGFKITEVKVNHRPRIRGKTKYGFRRLFTGFTDLMTLRFLFNYSQRPIRLFTKIGALSLLIALGFGIYLLVEKFVYRQDIGDRPLLLLTMLLGIAGFQFILTGFLAELIARQNVEPTSVYNIKKIYESIEEN